jgi:hypothetical protein
VTALPIPKVVQSLLASSASRPMATATVPTRACFSDRW